MEPLLYTYMHAHHDDPSIQLNYHLMLGLDLNQDQRDRTGGMQTTGRSL